MANPESIINFIETLLERDIMFLTSDEVHLKSVLDAFKLAKEEGKINRKTIDQLLDHYKAAGSVFNHDKDYSDRRTIEARMKAVVEKKDIGPVEYYHSVASAINYVSLIYGVRE